MNNRIVLTTGMALFAMFFGAGNIIYPLTLGATVGNHILYALIAFLIAGVGIPFLGLFATSLYKGDYWEFFGRLGKVPCFTLITFLILFIGPLFAVPRTETVTYHTLAIFLPDGFNNSYLVSGIYCIILFFLTYQPTAVIDIIGKFLSPIKLTLFVVLIIAGLMSAQATMVNHHPVASAIKEGLLDGYGTMDLLGAFFFCTVAYESVVIKAESHGVTDHDTIVKLFLKSCVLGGAILGFVYIGFTFVSLGHALKLQHADTAQMIEAVSVVVLGKYGSLFMAICVSFACIATATALIDVTANFIYDHVVEKKIHRNYCLIGALIVTYVMTIMGFAGIMKIALPLLEVLYPALIIYSIYSIYAHYKGLSS